MQLRRPMRATRRPERLPVGPGFKNSMRAFLERRKADLRARAQANEPETPQDPPKGDDNHD